MKLLCPAMVLLMSPAMAQTEGSVHEALAAYLSLTPAQTGEIIRNDGDYNARNERRRSRYFGIRGALSATTDPGRLGTGYAEIEMLRREMVADIDGVRSRNRSLMTPEQQRKLTAIENTRPLVILRHDAICAGLLRPVSPDTSRFYCGFTPSLGMKSYLGLSDVQAANLNAVIGDLTRAHFENQERISQLWREAAEETARDPVDPSRLGAVHAEIVRRQSEWPVSPQHTDRLRSVLTPQQEAKVRALEETAPLQRLLPTSECEGLIPFIYPREIRFQSRPGDVQFEDLRCWFLEGRP